jgi:EmrB/QacA subfamily drug resistance transporter
MHGRPAAQSNEPSRPSDPRRWQILGVLVLALLVTSIDHTIINVAMPRLVSDLGASAAQLQWIVASYTIVFAGLLLTAGSLGDRFGRRHALLAGLTGFLAGSVIAATAGSTAMLIAGRCVMGAGGALIMPTTLSILVNVFGDPRERAKAIAAWTAASAAGIALGPIIGGALMRSFSWSSVFWINVPLLVAAIGGAMHLVPDSRDPHATRLDPIGAVLSIAAISTLVYAIVQAPEHGWTATSSMANFAAGSVLAVVFVVWELRRDEPMLDVALFRGRGFSAGSITLTLLFFAMAGTVFLQAQYLQVVLGYTPLVAGVAIVPAAAAMLLGTGAGAHLAAMHGARVAVTAGTLLATAGIAVQAAFADGSSYLPTGIGLFLFGLGAGMAMPAATEVIMAGLPPSRAGVGSAVNDTVREFGGALGVAVIGSVAATSYASTMGRELSRFPELTATDRSLIRNNVGAAIDVTHRLGGSGNEIASAARSAFIDSMHTSLWIATVLALAAAVVARTQLPRHRHGQAVHGHAGHPGHLGHHAPVHTVASHPSEAVV